MEDLLTLPKESGTRQPMKWFSGSKKQGSLYLKAPVLWVVESWRGRKVSKLFASMEIREIQNSCSKHFILWISSVFAEQWRVGANNSASQRKRRDEIIYMWTKVCWQVYHHMKYNFWYLFRQGHLETVCKKILWISKRCPTEIQFSKLCEDAWFNHRVSAGMYYTTRLDEGRRLE